TVQPARHAVQGGAVDVRRVGVKFVQEIVEFSDRGGCERNRSGTRFRMRSAQGQGLACRKGGVVAHGSPRCRPVVTGTVRGRSALPPAAASVLDAMSG